MAHRIVPYTGDPSLGQVIRFPGRPAYQLIFDYPDRAEPLNLPPIEYDGRLPDSWRDQPLPMWARATDDGVGASYHIDQMRFVQVTALVGAGESLEIPIVDADGLPLIGVEFPPVVSLWLHTETVASENDHTMAPEDTFWIDVNTSYPMVEGLPTDATIGSYTIKVRRDPYPHWVLTLTHERDDSDYWANFCVSILSQGSVGHAASTDVEVGAAAVPGHYRCRLIWDKVDSLATVNGTLATINQRKMASLSVNVPHPNPTATTNAYFATDDGLVTDTNVFDVDYVPFVFVMQEHTAVEVSLTTQTDWSPTTIGHGMALDRLAHGDPLSTQAQVWGWTSRIDVVSGTHWRLGITPTGDTPGIPNRTYFAWGVGR